MAVLIALLAELDARRLYLAEGCSSLFTYCTQVLHLSEHASYHRIEAARAARRFPVILQLLADGALTLTTVALLRPHLTADNHQTLLTAAHHKSKRDVEHQIACLAPRPDAKPLVRRMTAPMAAPTPDAQGRGSVLLQSIASTPTSIEARPGGPRTTVPATRPTIAAVAAERYLLKVTLSDKTHAKLRRAQDLLRHIVPTGDPAAILDRALSLLVDRLERTKFAAVARPRPATRRSAGSSKSGSRYIPAGMKRAVWARDRGRCAFVGARGRCRETGRLEFHHIIPFASGGPTTVENLALRCSAHNGYESDVTFGRRRWNHAPPREP